MLLLLLMLILTGCGNGRLLDEIPRDFSVTGPGPLWSGESTEEEQAGADSTETGKEAEPEKKSPEKEAETEKEAENEKEAEAGEEETSGEEAEPGDETGSGDEEAAFLYDGAFEYAAQGLSEAELTWYQDIKEALGNFREDVRLDKTALAAGCDEKDIDRIFQCVLNDHPELFFVEGYSYTRYTRGDRITAVVFSGTYSMDREEAAARQEEIEEAAGKLLSGVDENADQYTKVKYVYDTIIRQTDYDPSAPDNQNIYSVFVSGRSVCQGYAKATQYLLNRLGVDCTLVLGTVAAESGRTPQADEIALEDEAAGEEGAVHREGHAWNLVRVDGEYYYVDTTWGDASYSRQDGGQTEDMGMPEINYDYLNVTTEELLKSHTLGDSIPMPLCSATAANYYVREGALFTSCDTDQMEALFDRARLQGRDDVTVKCADWECYTKVLQELVENHGIFRYMGEKDDTVAYARNDNQMSLTFWVTNE